MADDAKKEEKTLEMRVAELEDRLSKVHITEEEMAAFHKVSNLLAGGAAGAAGAAQGGPVAAGCVVDCSGCINECQIRPIVRWPIGGGIVRWPIVVRQCTWECFECGGGLPGTGGAAGFSQFGR